MPGIFSSIFGADAIEGPSENMGHAYVSPNDSFDDDNDGTQSALSFGRMPDHHEDGGVQGRGDTPSATPEPPTNAYIEDQSSGADASAF
ncbi:MAG: hypothetical protein KF730_11865 [Sphingomonas sp.]|uniref:hypothetical protein n=1 Tax=Sphingomonas sp. TaxID=28214 RepID=UPI00260012ED|nr:hypothetical protein [Sphingomonas sp.]MBX3565256.1 hypothetical protein [Sphingomonas sp.]